MAIRDNTDRLAAYAEGPFEGLCTPAEFAAEYGVDESAIRHAIRNGKLRPGIECFKFGKQWVLSKYAHPAFAKYGGYKKHSQLVVDYNKAKKQSGKIPLP